MRFFDASKQVGHLLFVLIDRIVCNPDSPEFELLTSGQMTSLRQAPRSVQSYLSPCVSGVKLSDKHDG